MEETNTLEGRTVFITGGSRGIGKAIALRLSEDGANVIIAAKTTIENPKLGGTIYSASDEIVAKGGQCLPVFCNVRDEKSVEAAVRAGIDRFGAIDILINNASAIQLSGTLDTDVKHFDLMHDVNTRGTWITSKACLPHLLKSTNPHILNISPPLSMNPTWFERHTAYTLSKYGMSMCALGMAREFAKHGVSVNTLWPLTSIATAATKMLGGEELLQRSRKPDIMADAAHAILIRPSGLCTGNFFIDEHILRAEGVCDFSKYAHSPGYKLTPDFFIDPSSSSQPLTRSNPITLLQMIAQILENRAFATHNAHTTIQCNVTDDRSHPEKSYTIELKRHGNARVTTEEKPLKQPGCVINLRMADLYEIAHGRMDLRTALSNNRATVFGDTTLAAALLNDAPINAKL